jgi:hypothetical protein
MGEVFPFLALCISEGEKRLAGRIQWRRLILTVYRVRSPQISGHSLSEITADELGAEFPLKGQFVGLLGNEPGEHEDAASRWIASLNLKKVLIL